MMAIMGMTLDTPPFFSKFNGRNNFTVKNNHLHVLTCHAPMPTIFFSARQNLDERLVHICNFRKSLGSFMKPIQAVGSGLAASISDDNMVAVKNAKILVESQDDDKMQVKVELKGKDTQMVFDKVLTNLARTAPASPGFRKQKGGKTSKVSESFVLAYIGKERVTKFVIQEIVSSTMADYVKKENLPVKDNKIDTIQTAEELHASFNPGSDFGFNVTIELEKPATGTSGSSSLELSSSSSPELENPDAETSSSSSPKA